MKKTLFSLFTFLMAGTAVHAQNPWVNDSVSMGAGSGNDVFYSMQNGNIKTENNMNWHLAFSMQAGDSSAIWANHNAGNAYVKVYNIHKPILQWNTVTLNDTLNAKPCFNMDQKWSQGALNDIPNPSPFHFGWGAYDMVTHNVYGDSLFIVKANNVFYKVAIDSLQSTLMTYHYRVGDIVAATENAMVLAKGTKYANSIFAYVDISTGTDSLREPDMATWDVVFNRYNSLVIMGPPPALPYSVVGALGNRGITFGKAVLVHVDTAHNNYTNYTSPWSNVISTIGFDWKTFIQPAGPWVVPDSNSYFILDKNSKIWQLQFTGYSGSGTGNIYFRKRWITPVKVEDVYSNINQYSIYPVPATGQMNLVLDMKQSSSAQLFISDISGRVLFKTTLNVQSGLNAFSIPVQQFATGNYILNISGTNIDIKEKIAVAQ